MKKVPTPGPRLGFREATQFSLPPPPPPPPPPRSLQTLCSFSQDAVSRFRGFLALRSPRLHLETLREEPYTFRKGTANHSGTRCALKKGIGIDGIEFTPGKPST